MPFITAGEEISIEPRWGIFTPHQGRHVGGGEGILVGILPSYQDHDATATHGCGRRRNSRAADPNLRPTAVIQFPSIPVRDLCQVFDFASFA